MIGEAEGQSDFAHLLLVAVVTFTPVGIYDQVMCGRRACVSNCGSMCIYFEWKKTQKRDTGSIRHWSLQLNKEKWGSVLGQPVHCSL